MRLPAPRIVILAVLALAIPAAGPAGAQGRPRAPDGVPPNPFASNYPSRPPKADRPRRARPAGADLRPPRDIPARHGLPLR